MQLSGFTQRTNGQGKFNSSLLDRSIMLLHSLYITNLLYLCMSTLLNFYPSSTTLAFQKCRTFCYKRDRSSLSPTSLRAPSNNWLDFNTQLRNEFGEYGCSERAPEERKWGGKGGGDLTETWVCKGGKKNYSRAQCLSSLKDLTPQRKGSQMPLSQQERPQ